MKSIIFGFVFLLTYTFTFAQTQPPFEKEILDFEAKDNSSKPPKNAILFTGSSSIRLWPEMERYFPGKVILQRGFGGSQLSDVIRYADRVIIKYKPKQVVVYAGENDIALNVSAQEVYNRFVTLFTHVRTKLPKTPFVFISLKPSPSRRKHQAAVREANDLIRAYLAKHKKTTFVDVYTPMLNGTGPDAPIRGELFKSDSLHMNEKGYQIWAEKLRPVLR
ncbi:GDSL-type esterase/lipase family protein [Tellurirhabdus bombi]|uniref:GDSL-type esterase/lipase family protein n=1 Tax=Tellurirhabdus bombi TaxID=2907205 RepID=UPI001F3D6C26|nr:GDSL-type esterase/lipase family protein [Tellurirhabdus bombi]